jgi:hypothetical protein
MARSLIGRRRRVAEIASVTADCVDAWPFDAVGFTGQAVSERLDPRREPLEDEYVRGGVVVYELRVIGAIQVAGSSPRKGTWWRVSGSGEEGVREDMTLRVSASLLNWGLSRTGSVQNGYRFTYQRIPVRYVNTRTLTALPSRNGPPD